MLGSLYNISYRYQYNIFLGLCKNHVGFTVIISLYSIVQYWKKYPAKFTLNEIHKSTSNFSLGTLNLSQSSWNWSHGTHEIKSIFILTVMNSNSTLCRVKYIDVGMTLNYCGLFRTFYVGCYDDIH